MNPQALFGPDMPAALEVATAPVNEADILPPVLYASTEFHAFEKEAIIGVMRWTGDCDTTLRACGKPVVLHIQTNALSRRYK